MSDLSPQLRKCLELCVRRNYESLCVQMGMDERDAANLPTEWLRRYYFEEQFRREVRAIAYFKGEPID